METVGVVKIGGACGNDPGPVLEDLAERFRRGQRWVLVHGVSGPMDSLCRKVGLTPRYVTSPSGFRSRFVGDVEMALFEAACLSETSRICFSLAGLGVPAVPVDPVRGQVVFARTKDCIREKTPERTRVIRGNRSGTVSRVQRQKIESIMAGGFMPVFPPLAFDPQKASPVNIDGDRAAAAISASLRAEVLVLLTNVPGLLSDPSDPDSLIERLGLDEIETASKAARGNMKRKVLACREALEAGVSTAIIADSRVETPLTSALVGGGTRLCRAESTGIAV